MFVPTANHVSDDVCPCEVELKQSIVSVWPAGELRMLTGYKYKVGHGYWDKYTQKTKALRQRQVWKQRTRLNQSLW